MKQFGPYAIDSTIPEDAFVGFDKSLAQLYTLVGKFEENISTVQGVTVRQDIDAKGRVLTDVYGGPPIGSRVSIWNNIHD